MLKKIEYYYDDDDNEQIDISELKIYWDTNQNVFRHKFYCINCEKPLGCSCFRHLNDIISAIDLGYNCNKCFILDTWNDEEEYALEVARDVDKLHRGCGDFEDRVKLMQLLNNQGEFNNEEINEKCEELAQMIYEELFEELKSISDEDFDYIGYGTDDYNDDGGYSCEI